MGTLICALAISGKYCISLHFNLSAGFVDCTHSINFVFCIYEDYLYITRNMVHTAVYSDRI